MALAAGFFTYYLADHSARLKLAGPIPPTPKQFLDVQAEFGRECTFAAAMALAGLALILIPAYFALRHHLRTRRKR